MLLDQDSFVTAKGSYEATQQPLHLPSTVHVRTTALWMLAMVQEGHGDIREMLCLISLLECFLLAGGASGGTGTKTPRYMSGQCL